MSKKSQFITCCDDWIKTKAQKQAHESQIWGPKLELSFLNIK